MIVGTIPEKVELPFEVPENACNGHFPDNPLVPGILQLQLVAEALGAGPKSQVAVGAVPRLRFRKPIVPGDVATIEAKRSGSTWRFRIIAGRRIVTEGALEMAALTPFDPSDEVASILEEFPPPDECLPHRDPMLLVDGIVEMGDGWGICRGTVPANAPFVRADWVPALASIEVAAQSLGYVEAAAHFEAGPPKMGMLVGVTNARLSTSGFAVGAQLQAHVQRTAWVPPMARAEARITSGNHEIATCTLTTWTPDHEENAQETADRLD